MILLRGFHISLEHRPHNPVRNNSQYCSPNHIQPIMLPQINTGIRHQKSHYGEESREMPILEKIHKLQRHKDNPRAMPAGKGSGIDSFNEIMNLFRFWSFFEIKSSDEYNNPKREYKTKQ